MKHLNSVLNVALYYIVNLHPIYLVVITIDKTTSYHKEGIRDMDG